MKKIWEMGRACSHNSANLAGAAQRPDCAPEGSTTLNVGKKRSRLLKVFAASGLAFFMGIGTLCGVLITPINTSLNNKSAQTQTENQFSNNGEVISSSPLGLDPENDPVVYTTSSGLEIKAANALTHSKVTSYTYFTMGTYNNSAVNWVIIGYDSTLSSYVGSYNNKTVWNPIQSGYYQTSTVDKSPAGVAILKDSFPISSSAKSNDEIGDYCVLAISEYCMGPYVFRSSLVSSGASSDVATMDSNFNNSTLKTTLNSLDTTLGFTANQKALIKPQTLYNWFFSTSSTTTNQKFFPMACLDRGSAGTNQNFRIDNYLTTNDSRIGYSFGTTTVVNYWTRTGHKEGSAAYDNNVHVVGVYQNSSYYPAGGLYDCITVNNGNVYIRPAFVLKLV